MLLWSLWSFEKTLCKSRTKLSLFLKKTDKNTLKIQKFHYLGPMYVCSQPLRKTYLIPSGTQPTSKVSDCLVIVYRKYLKERERDGGTRHICAKRNYNLESAAISKNLQFKFHCPFRVLLAVKWSSTCNFTSVVLLYHSWRMNIVRSDSSKLSKPQM